MSDLTQLLKSNVDSEYKKFHQKLVPDTKYQILGVRVPIIKKIAKDNVSTANKFLAQKHVYYEEFMLHALLINKTAQDLDSAFRLIDEFLPSIDNWAICDSLVASLKIFKTNPSKVYSKMKEYLNSTHPYTVRFAIVVFLTYFTDIHFTDEIFKLSKNCCCENYYVNMAIAWLYSVCLIKNYDKTVMFLLEANLPKFVHNKAIQKAIESYRISNEKKIFLKSIKQK